jgi:hypothetical protein
LKLPDLRLFILLLEEIDASSKLTEDWLEAGVLKKGFRLFIVVFELINSKRTTFALSGFPI